MVKLESQLWRPQTLGFLVLFLFSLQAWGLNFPRRGDRLFIRDSSCDVVSSLTRLLDQWTQNTGARKNCPIHHQNPGMNEGFCEFDITDCVPDHVVDYQGKMALENGPNCWNLALRMNGLISGERWSNEPEMTLYMQGPTCRPLADGEARQPGDVVAVRKVTNGSFIEIHGFTSISNELVYSKNGLNKENAYRLQNLNTVLNTYGVPNRANCRGNTIHAEEKCGRATAYFRCSTMAKYLDQARDLSAPLLVFQRDIERFEKLLGIRVMQGTPISDSERQNFLAAARSYVDYVLNDPSPRQNTIGNQFLIRGIRLRLQLISATLWYINTAQTISPPEFYKLKGSLDHERRRLPANP